MSSLKRNLQVNNNETCNKNGDIMLQKVGIYCYIGKRGMKHMHVMNQHINKKIKNNLVLYNIPHPPCRVTSRA